MHFMDTDPAVLMVINKNGEMQRIYCCDTKLQLQKQGKDKTQRFESKQSALEQQVTDAVKVDYTFIQNEKRLAQALSKKHKAEQSLAPTLSLEETQVRRLDEADRSAGFGGLAEFST